MQRILRLGLLVFLTLNACSTLHDKAIESVDFKLSFDKRIALKQNTDETINESFSDGDFKMEIKLSNTFSMEKENIDRILITHQLNDLELFLNGKKQDDVSDSQIYVLLGSVIADYYYVPKKNVEFKNSDPFNEAIVKCQKYIKFRGNVYSSSFRNAFDPAFFQIFSNNEWAQIIGRWNGKTFILNQKYFEHNESNIGNRKNTRDNVTIVTRYQDSNRYLIESTDTYTGIVNDATGGARKFKTVQKYSIVTTKDLIPIRVEFVNNLNPLNAMGETGKRVENIIIEYLPME